MLVCAVEGSDAQFISLSSEASSVRVASSQWFVFMYIKVDYVSSCNLKLTIVM